jgi:hypothetical protein
MARGPHREPDESEALTRLADEDQRYSAARRRWFAAVRSARSLGTQGPDMDARRAS